MEQRRFGLTHREVPVVGQGTWYRRGVTSRCHAGAPRPGARMTHIDTAEMYGAAEPVVAAAIQDRRDEVFLV